MWHTDRWERERRDRARMHERVRLEAALAAEYIQQHPDLSRDEALRLAAKHVAKDLTLLA